MTTLPTDPADAIERAEKACRNCRRPLVWLEGVGWLHAELPQYAHEPIGCDIAHPASCKHPAIRPCPHGWTP
jgi:hypothetical protein